MLFVEKWNNLGFFVVVVFVVELVIVNFLEVKFIMGIRTKESIVFVEVSVKRFVVKPFVAASVNLNENFSSLATLFEPW